MDKREEGCPGPTWGGLSDKGQNSAKWMPTRTKLTNLGCEFI